MIDIEDLYIKGRKKYVNIMSSILRGDRAAAEDVVQEAFCRAWKFKESFNPERGKPEVWFNSILYNSLKDYQQEMRGQPSHLHEGISIADVFSSTVLPANLINLISKRIEETKNPKHSRVLELFFIMGYTSTEISQIERKVSVSNITTIVTRFRQSLMKELKWTIK